MLFALCSKRVTEKRFNKYSLAFISTYVFYQHFCFELRDYSIIEKEKKMKIILTIKR